MKVNQIKLFLEVYNLNEEQLKNEEYIQRLYENYLEHKLLFPVNPQAKV